MICFLLAEIPAHNQYLFTIDSYQKSRFIHTGFLCGFRQKAELAEDIFEEGMRLFALNGTAQIVNRLLLDNYKKFVKNPFDEKKQIAQEIDRLNAKLSVARNKLLAETIDDEEYLEIKKEYRERIESLEEQLSKDGSDTKKINVEKFLDRALNYIESIPKMYSEGEIRTRRDIIGSIFPEKLEFDGKTYRTARMNVIANYIFQINNGLV